MSKGMLGRLLLAEVQGPRNDLEIKLAGAKGKLWLRRLKLLLREEDAFGIPQTFEITTDGRSGEQLITDLQDLGSCVGAHAQEILRSPNFVASTGITHRLALIRGEEFGDFDRCESGIRDEAGRRGHAVPPLELAPYILEMFSDKDLKQAGLKNLVVMHEPFIDVCDRRTLLCIAGTTANSYYVIPVLKLGVFFISHINHRYLFDRDIGFLFLNP